jgi:hypothetical protein
MDQKESYEIMILKSYIYYRAYIMFIHIVYLSSLFYNLLVPLYQGKGVINMNVKTTEELVC